jgi:predicted nucleotidyltransferase component of viral defense system
MNLSREKLLDEAKATGFRPDMLEKAIRLLALLDALRTHPFLKGKLALKGGTALNLFVFEVPRLSVDIDLNYVGSADREVMMADRPKVEQAVTAVCQREGFEIRRMPDEHAGGKFSLRYQSALGAGGNLEWTSTSSYACLSGLSSRGLRSRWARSGQQRFRCSTSMSLRQGSSQPSWLGMRAETSSMLTPC